jgi:hypothetical protein
MVLTRIATVRAAIRAKASGHMDVRDAGILARACPAEADRRRVEPGRRALAEGQASPRLSQPR